VLTLALVLASAALAQPGPDVPAVHGETPTPYRMGEDGHGPVARAVAASRADHRTVVVMFGGNWCIWCRRLDYALTHDPVLAPIVQRSYRFVHVDSRANHALDDELGHPTSHGVPVLVVLDADGHPIFTQDTGLLELGDGHSRTRVESLLHRYEPRP
jgi:thiol:disulfide interchange protein